MTQRHVAVIDIGKTNAKLALVNTADLSEITVVTRPNTVLAGPPYPHFDVETIWSFLLDALEAFHNQHRVDAISVTTHGASGALLKSDGSLAAPILDYEYTGPNTVAAAYDAIRPAFEETGSPRLPVGLNLGAQLHWQFLQDPGLHDRTTSIVTYPQYWGYRLTGELACDVSSLGCHTDLWNPFDVRFSTLVDRLNISAKIAPARKSADVLGPLLPQIAKRTGLKADTQVLCGIHDSNASLLPHVLWRKSPFSVVSTGTWVIVMTVGGAEVVLDPHRDALINVNALGAPVPSARFMGGREYETILGEQCAMADGETLHKVAETGSLLMPSIVPESGPFQGRKHHWIGLEPESGSPERTAALCFYLAMVTAECLSLTNHDGLIVVEGPFAKNTAYCDMLSVATDCPVLAAESMTGTSQGAALLSLDSDRLARTMDSTPRTPVHHVAYRAYARRWREAATG